jgi:hypothetical protein
LSQQLIDAVGNVLMQDVEFMAFLDLTPSSSDESIVERIVKGVEPEKVITGDSVPMMLIYIMPGRFGRNHLVYEGKFCLDIYAPSSADARRIAEQAFKLFHDENIRQQALNTFRCSLVYDTDFATGITGVKGYKAIYDVDYIRMN